MHRTGNGPWRCNTCAAIYRQKRKDDGKKPKLTGHQYYLLQRAQRDGDPVNEVQGPIRPGHQGESDLTWMRAAAISIPLLLAGEAHGGYGTKKLSQDDLRHRPRPRERKEGRA
jgi:hypothetical protein